MAAVATTSAVSLVTRPSIVEPAPDQHEPAAPLARNTLEQRRGEGKQPTAIGLVEVVVHRRRHELVVVGQTRNQQTHGVQVAHDVAERDLSRQAPARVGRRELLVRHDGDEAPRIVEGQLARDDVVRLAHAGDDQTSERGGGGVLGVTVESRGDREGSAAFAAAAAATASAAEDPSPLDIGIDEVTRMAKLVWPSTLLATRTPRWRSSSKRPAPQPSLTMLRLSAGSRVTST